MTSLKLPKKAAARQPPVVGTPGRFRKALSSDGHRQIEPPLRSDVKNSKAPAGKRNAKG